MTGSRQNLWEQCLKTNPDSERSGGTCGRRQVHVQLVTVGHGDTYRLSLPAEGVVPVPDVLVVFPGCFYKVTTRYMGGLNLTA